MSDSPKPDPTLIRPVEAMGSPLVQPPPTIGAYAIERLLGRGGMAAVYLAKDRRSGRPVALKLMDPSLSAEPSLVERFMREAKLCASLRHKNVVEVLSFGESGGWFYFACEFVQGGTVTELLSKMGELPPVLAAELFGQMLEGLQHAHDAGMVHRDLKPDNLLLTPQGVLKIADFGIARAADSAKLTRTGMLIGTAAYMSPEQARGEEVDSRSDLFSAGIVLYEMLTGTNPFHADSVAASVMRILHFTLPSLRELRPAAPLELDALLDGLVVFDRQARLDSARVGAELLKPLLAASRQKYPQLVSDCIAAPKDRRQSLEADAALAMIADARAAIGESTPLAFNRAAVKLQLALAIDGSNVAAKQLWDALSKHVRVSLAPTQNPRLLELEEAVKTDLGNAALFGQISQLYKEEGNLLKASAAMRRYLKLKPQDPYAAQELFQLTGEVSKPSATRPSAPRPPPPRASAPRPSAPGMATPAPASPPRPEVSPFAPPPPPPSQTVSRIKWLAGIGLALVVLEVGVWWVIRKLERWTVESDKATEQTARLAKPVVVVAPPDVDAGGAEPSVQVDASKRFDQATRAERRGETEKAIAAYRALKDEFPDRVEGTNALFRLGVLLLAQSRNSEARETFSEYLERNPDGADAAEALLRRGQAAAKNLDDKGALADWDELIKQDGSSAFVHEAWVLRAELKARKGDARGARVDFSEAMKRIDAADPLHLRAQEGAAKLDAKPETPPAE